MLVRLGSDRRDGMVVHLFQRDSLYVCACARALVCVNGDSVFSNYPLEKRMNENV